MKEDIAIMKVGFIGLGRMGKHMAANVVKAGFETYVNDLVPALVDQLTALGAKHCPTNQSLAAEVDVRAGGCVRRVQAWDDSGGHVLRGPGDQPEDGEDCRGEGCEVH